MTIARSPGKRGAPLSQEVCDRARLLYSTHDWNTACELLGISSATLSHLKRRDFKAKPRAKKPMPHDFVFVARGRNQHWLMAHYKTTGRTVARWRKESGVPAPRSGQPGMPIPDDFAQRSVTMSRAMLAEHYGVCRDTIHRWKHATGTIRKPAPVRTLGWAERMYQREAA